MALSKRLADRLPERARSRLKRLYYHHAWLRWALYGPLDGLSGTLGLRDPLVPPRALQIVGDGDFRKVGRYYLERFRELGGLEPGQHVLDVGCGLGRMALALAEAGCGPYQGFDIVPGSVRWARNHIGRRFPQFQFDHADVRNGMYNPKGTIAPEAFTFPYAADRFDFVIATSVFTHLVGADAERYLREIRRVMRPQGRCFATFFVADSDLSDPYLPEAAVTYDAARLGSLLATAGLGLARPLVPDFQHIAILSRAS